MPTWLHFWMKFPPRCPPSCPQDALGRPSLAPKIAQEPPKRRPRCAKSRRRAAPEPSRKRPTGALGRRHATRQPQAPSRPRFWTILATICKDFGRILDGFFDGFLEGRNGQIDRTGRETDRQNCSFVTFRFSAVAGTQLCCALDPPRQALCLRLAYRVPLT